MDAIGVVVGDVDDVDDVGDVVDVGDVGDVGDVDDVDDVVAEEPAKVALAQDDDVIDEFALAGTNPSLRCAEVDDPAAAVTDAYLRRALESFGEQPLDYYESTCLCSSIESKAGHHKLAVRSPESCLA